MVMLLLLIFVFYVTRNKSFTASFIGLSATYFFVFYVYPLTSLIGSSSFYYAGFYQSFNFELAVFAMFSGFLFVIGFFVPDTFLYFKKAKYKFLGDVFLFSKKQNTFETNKLFFILLAFIVIYYSAGFLDFNRAEKGYAVRSSEIQGSWLMLLLGIVMKSIFYSVLFVFIFLEKKKSAIVLLLIMLIYLLTGSTGRANLTFTLVLFFLVFTNFKVRNLVFLSVLGVFIFLPVLLNMKYIIYSISVEAKIPNLYEMYFTDLGLEAIISNLGHPLVSLIKVEGLVDNVGFRYFYDYLQGFLFYLRALGINVGDSLIYFNTENLIGRRLSIIPTGYLAFGYVQLGYIGILVSGIFYRLVGYIAEYVFYRVNTEHEAVKFYFCYTAAASFYHGEVRVMVMTFFIPIFIVYFFRPERLIKGTA